MLGDNCKEIFEIAKIDTKARPQDLTVLQWCTLAHTYENWLKSHPHELKVLNMAVGVRSIWGYKYEILGKWFFREKEHVNDGANLQL